MLPNFLIIGAPKAGTTSLYGYLQQHPQIYMSPVKEPHFFTFEGEKINFAGPGDQERLQGAVTTIEQYRQLFDQVREEIAIGEASTTYLSSAKAVSRIRYYLPQVKIIAILRNPIDAAYASFLHLIRDGDETITDFVLALKQEEKRIQQNWDGLWHYQSRGFYYSQVKSYFDTFDRQQIKIYLYEDFQTNCDTFLQDLWQFLGVDDSFIPDMTQQLNVSAIPKNNTLNKLLMRPNGLKSAIKSLLPITIRSYLADQLKNWNYNQYQKPEMSPEIRTQLTLTYKEDILKLQELIEQDLSHWLKALSSQTNVSV